MRGKRKILTLIAAVLLILLAFSQTALAEKRRVFDEAGLFTAQEKEHLETALSDFREEYPADLGILTVKDAGGKTAEEYADDFYDSHGLGAGEKYSGALLSIDMDHRELWLSTLGETSSVLTDQRIKKILDAAYDSAAEGDYAACALTAIDEIGRFMEAGVPAGQYDYIRKKQGRSLRWYEILFALAVSGIAAASPCLSTVNQYKMKKEQRQSLNYRLAYRGSCAYRFELENEKFLNRTVVQERIPRNSGSGGASGRSAGRTTLHRSSSGRMHGGGGRKF